jgi:thiol-disulfide isomerase/thioredoxin
MRGVVRAIVICTFIIAKVAAATKISEYLPRTLPASALYDLSGREVTLDRLEGNVLLVHFWATWCASCADEMKSLNQLQKLLRKDPIVIIPVSEDFKGAETVKAFYNKFDLKFLPAFVDQNNKWFKEMKVENLPATFIIDSQGRNVLRMSGEVDWLDEKNIALVKKYISSKQPYNQDYVSLLNEYSVVSDKPKQESNNKIPLQAVETNLALNLDGALEQGEIRMAGAPKAKLSDRRPVNLGVNKGE